MSRFPKDCWDKNCKHFHVHDMSIDDLLCACDVNGMECDACDEDFSLSYCPLKEEIKVIDGIVYRRIIDEEGDGGVITRRLTVRRMKNALIVFSTGSDRRITNDKVNTEP